MGSNTVIMLDTKLISSSFSSFIPDFTNNFTENEFLQNNFFSILFFSVLVTLLIFNGLYSDVTIKKPGYDNGETDFQAQASHTSFKPVPKLSVGKMKDDMLQHKVNAAAKLAMQDLDPESVKQRHIFMSSDVSGLLAVHMRHLCSFNKMYFNTSSFQHDDILALVVTVSVNYVTKQSKTVH